VVVWLNSAAEMSGSTATRSDSAVGEAQRSSGFYDEGVLLLRHGHGEAEDGRRLGSSGTSSVVATACRPRAVTQRGRAEQALVGRSMSWWWRCVAQSTGTSTRRGSMEETN
jgi:hypothetical protein